MRLEARSIGPMAAKVLGRPGRAKVIATFERSFCLDAGDALITVACGSLHDGPFNILVAVPPAARGFTDLGVTIGQHWTRTSDRRLQGTGLTIATDGAAAWMPRRPPSRLDQRRLIEGCRILRQSASVLYPEDGLSRLALFADASPLSATERAAVLPLRALRGTMTSGGADVDDAAIGLLGLGPGLTPSGDDLLAGAFLTWHWLGERRAMFLIHSLLAAAADRTTPISLAYLRAAAEGFGAAPIHALLDAVGEGHAGRITEALDAVSAIGHCSGWDAVGGIVLALTAWLDPGANRSVA